MRVMPGLSLPVKVQRQEEGTPAMSAYKLSEETFQTERKVSDESKINHS